MSTHENIDSDVSEADVANGEPEATDENRTGDAQAEENQENDPPA